MRDRPAERFSRRDSLAAQKAKVAAVPRLLREHARSVTGEDGVTNVTSYYDWSKVSGDLKERFPIVPESALRATLGILERTARKGR